MPIVESENGVHIEYAIPLDIKILITDDFLNEFLYQLIRITGMQRLERLVLTQIIRNYLIIEIHWNGMIQIFLIQK